MNETILNLIEKAREMYPVLKELNGLLLEATNDNTIDLDTRISLESYYQDLPSEELLDFLIDDAQSAEYNEYTEED